MFRAFILGIDDIKFPTKFKIQEDFQKSDTLLESLNRNNIHVSSLSIDIPGRHVEVFLTKPINYIGEAKMIDLINTYLSNI